MINKIVFADEITLWWKEESFAETNLQYQCYLNGELHGSTDKTHYSFLGLQAYTDYQIKVETWKNGELLRSESFSVQTPKSKNKLDVSKPPYNAVGNGKTLNTQALQKALDDCTENDCVYFPAGTYLTGALDVHSNTEMYIETGATLQGSSNETDYLPKIRSRFEGEERECYRSLINIGTLDSKGGYYCENVVIRGAGAIYGGGLDLATRITEVEKIRLRTFMQENADYVKSCENENTIPARARGRLININNTQNVIIAGLALGYAASWNVHFVYSKNIITYGCSITSVGVWNGDGWDPDSSENCVIFNTVFDTHDNAIAAEIPRVIRIADGKILTGSGEEAGI